MKKNLLEIVNCNDQINDIRYLNRYFKNINNSLVIGGIYKGNVETYSFRSIKILNKTFSPLNRIFLFYDTIFFRLFPRLNITKWLFFLITNGKNRAFSKAEIFGRLFYCGFEIIEEEYLNNKIFFTAKKIFEPKSNNIDPYYGIIIKLQRLGQFNNMINVYKLRTMRPYSEFLQEFIFKKNKLQEGGKIKNDFRISSTGKILRRFWIDEIPMLWNVLNGTMKLVGVRPISKHYFSLYSKEHQNFRSKFKPGFIPPFYVDLPETFEEIIASEKKYLKLYLKSPFLTDLKYFFLAFKNVLFKGARSS